MSLMMMWLQVLTLTLVYRSLPKLGKLNFATDFSLNELEATECGLEIFFEKVCMESLAALQYLTMLSSAC